MYQRGGSERKALARQIQVRQCCRGIPLGKGGSGKSCSCDQVSPLLLYSGRHLFVCVWEWIRENQRLIWYHGCCSPLQVGWVTRKSLSEAWALSALYIPFSWVYTYWVNASTFLAIFILHAHAYIKIHTQTDTYHVSLEAMKTDKLFLEPSGITLIIHTGLLITVKTSPLCSTPLAKQGTSRKQNWVLAAEFL